jgi:ABC-type cobalamin/Fe3+-siderophores transport system ATPase subunit
MLLANNISFYRNNNIIFKDVSLALPPQKIINITGANGIGKTTLLKILTHVLIPKKGNIFWNGKNIKKIFLIIIKMSHLSWINKPLI